tara:strand:- start:14924 stop:15295 length:372 start_codon:yes stop_codon:yes gene_type:complete
MRTSAGDSYRHPEEFEKDKAQFMANYNYMKLSDPENYEDWFDKEAIDKYVRGIFNPDYNNTLFGVARNEKTSTTRIPTRCEKCKKPWAIEYMSNSFEENYLDVGLYHNIPMVKGDCKECREDK